MISCIGQLIEGPVGEVGSPVQSGHGGFKRRFNFRFSSEYFCQVFFLPGGQRGLGIFANILNKDDKARSTPVVGGLQEPFEVGRAEGIGPTICE